RRATRASGWWRWRRGAAARRWWPATAADSARWSTTADCWCRQNGRRRSPSRCSACCASRRSAASSAGAASSGYARSTGLPAARNVLLAASTAELVCFLDDDVDVGRDLGERLLICAASEPDLVGWGPVVEVRPPAVRRLHRLGQLGSLRDPRRLLARRCD